MENVMNVYNFVLDNGVAVLAALLSILIGLETLAKFTKTNKDDKAIAKAKGIVIKLKEFAKKYLKNGDAS